MEYDKYVKIPWFIILDRNICVGNKLLYGIILLLSHKEGYCYADNKYLGNYLGIGSRRISSLLKELAGESKQKLKQINEKIEAQNVKKYKVKNKANILPDYAKKIKKLLDLNKPKKN